MGLLVGQEENLGPTHVPEWSGVIGMTRASFRAGAGRVGKLDGDCPF